MGLLFRLFLTFSVEWVGGWLGWGGVAREVVVEVQVGVELGNSKGWGRA